MPLFARPQRTRRTGIETQEARRVAGAEIRDSPEKPRSVRRPAREQARLTRDGCAGGATPLRPVRCGYARADRERSGQQATQCRASPGLTPVKPSLTKHGLHFGVLALPPPSPRLPTRRVDFDEQGRRSHAASNIAERPRSTDSNCRWMARYAERNARGGPLRPRKPRAWRAILVGAERRRGSLGERRRRGGGAHEIVSRRQTRIASCCERCGCTSNAGGSRSVVGAGRPPRHRPDLAVGGRCARRTRRGARTCSDLDDLPTTSWDRDRNRGDRRSRRRLPRIGGESRRATGYPWLNAMGLGQSQGTLTYCSALTIEPEEAGPSNSTRPTGTSADRRRPRSSTTRPTTKPCPWR